jgi:transposase
MEIKNFIGIDVSKNTLDISIVVEGKVLSHQCIGNNTKEIRGKVSKMLKQNNASFSDTIFCMEHTGIYNNPLVKWLSTNSGKIWIESGIQISRSMGMVRGKNDKVDSQRIALYAYSNQHKMTLKKLPRLVIEKITSLLSQRLRYMKSKKQLSVPVIEQQEFMDKEIVKHMHRSTLKVIKVLDEQIQAVEKSILELIHSDENLKKLYKLINSVDGIGFVTAAYVITTTNEFLSITEAKKYACYSGVVPFEYSSGVSIKGRNRVSHMANKHMKQLFHMASMSAIQSNEELKQYYQRKVAEGKNKMSVINAVRNKLVLRIFSCVKNERMFEKKYQYSLV